VSTSLLYHAFGIQGYLYERTAYVGGEIHFTIRQPDEKLRCAVCGNRRVIRNGNCQHSCRMS
jgi:hypothetical protein